MPENQASLLEALLSPDAYPHATSDIRIVETHISCVFLTGRFAYKIKKAIRLSFLDFSTLELRERDCRDELVLNQRLAPELYLDVVPIGGDRNHPRIGGSPVLEYAVKMLQFAPESAADRLIEADDLGASEIAKLAELIARFHMKLPRAAAEPAGIGVLNNLAELESALQEDAGSRVDAIGSWLRAETGQLAELIAERTAQGSVRECHGDLHLGNIARIDDRLVPFDCLEFDRGMRTIDVIDEVAFVHMDLAAHERPDLAFAFLNRYLATTGDYAALRLLRYYAAHRALVRAKVAVIGDPAGKSGAAARDADRYLAAAGRIARHERPLLLITVGLSGSGKTSLARPLALSLGAVHLRSDVERKRRYEMDPLARDESGIEQGIYDQTATEATYRQLAHFAEAALAGGVPIIVDASFILRHRRNRFRSLAERHGACFVILGCNASVQTLRKRIRERSRLAADASDASEAVLDHQLESADPPGDEEQAYWLAIDTEEAVDIAQLASNIGTQAQVSLSSTSY